MARCDGLHDCVILVLPKSESIHDFIGKSCISDLQGHSTPVDWHDGSKNRERVVRWTLSERRAGGSHRDTKCPGKAFFVAVPLVKPVDAVPCLDIQADNPLDSRRNDSTSAREGIGHRVSSLPERRTEVISFNPVLGLKLQPISVVFDVARCLQSIVEDEDLISPILNSILFNGLIFEEDSGVVQVFAAKQRDKIAPQQSDGSIGTDVCIDTSPSTVASFDHLLHGDSHCKQDERE